MSVIAVGAIGIGAAVGFGAVAAGVATVATVLTVAAVVGVIGIGLTIAGKVTKNKLLGQVGMVMAMGAIGAAGGAWGAGYLGFGAAAQGAGAGVGAGAGAGTGAAGTSGAATSTTTAASAEALAATTQPLNVAAGTGGGAVNFAAPAAIAQPAGSGVLAAGQGTIVGGAVVAPASPTPSLLNLESSTGVRNVAENMSRDAFTRGASQGLDTGPATNFFSTPAGMTGTLAAVGGVAQMGGGMLQGLGASKAAQFNAEIQQKQLELERAKWERGNAAVPVQYTRPTFAPTAPTAPTVG